MAHRHTRFGTFVGNKAEVTLLKYIISVPLSRRLENEPVRRSLPATPSRVIMD